MSHDKEQRNKTIIAASILIASILLLLFSMSGSFFHGKVTHDFPQGYGASDAYWTLSDVDWTVRAGMYRTASPNLIGFVDIPYPTYEPPLIMYFAGGLSTVLGIPHYDAVNLGLTLLIVCAFVALFCMLFRIGINAAIPFTPYIAIMQTFPFLVLYSWGFWRQAFAISLFFMGLFFLVQKRSMVRNVTVGIIVGAAILAYGAWAAYFVIVIVAFELVYLVRTRQLLEFVKNGISMAGIALAIGSPYLPDLAAGRTEQAAFGSNVLIAITEAYFPTNAGVGWSQIVWPILVMIAVVIVILCLRSRNEYEQSVYTVLMLAVLVSLLPSITGSFGRAHQLRWMWPLLFYAILSCAFYIATTSIHRTWLAQKIEPRNLMSIGLLCCIVVGALILPRLSWADQEGGILSKEAWQSFRYIGSTTPVSSHVLLIDPTITQNGVVLSINRHTSTIDNLGTLTAINNGLPLNATKPVIFCTYAKRRFDWSSLSFEQLPPTSECIEKVRTLCWYNYVIVRLIQAPEYLQWLQRSELTDTFVKDRDFGDYTIMKNKDGACRDAA